MAALRAFSAFVERGNLTDAGAALGVSHAAISQQLRQLEKHLGVALFDRRGRALRLTDAGATLARACTDGFGTIANAIDELTGANDARPLHIATTATFAAAWLMPRLPGFQVTHPGVNILIDPSPQLARMDPGGPDLAIRHGAGHWPGLDSRMLLESPLVVVAAPSLVADRIVRTADDLADLPWLEEPGTTESSRWLHTGDLAQRPTGRVTQVPGNLLLDGARNGSGIAVTVAAFVAADIAAGRLVVLFQQDAPNTGYHLVTRPGPQRPALRAMTRWLRAEAKKVFA